MSLPSSSIALFRHPEQSEKLWLAVWDADASHFDFVTAERLEGESWRECLDREIAWTLDLQRGKEYIISSMARLHLDLSSDSHFDEDRPPFDLPQPPKYSAVEFYVVDLYGKTGEQSLAENTMVRWLDSEEVLSGRTNNGQSVSPHLVALLKRADVISRFKTPE